MTSSVLHFYCCLLYNQLWHSWQFKTTFIHYVRVLQVRRPGTEWLGSLLKVLQGWHQGFDRAIFLSRISGGIKPLSSSTRFMEELSLLCLMSLFLCSLLARGHLAPRSCLPLSRGHNRPFTRWLLLFFLPGRIISLIIIFLIF